MTELEFLRFAIEARRLLKSDWKELLHRLDHDPGFRQRFGDWSEMVAEQMVRELGLRRRVASLENECFGRSFDALPLMERVARLNTYAGLPGRSSKKCTD